MTNEPAYEKTYDRTCATREDLDQPAHLCSLLKVVNNRMCFLQPPGNANRDKQEPLPYPVNIQADRSLCWSHRSYCRFALVQMEMNVQ